jgi:hypothetical protein
MLYKSNLESQIAVVAAEQLSKSKILNEAGNQDIFDFQERLNQSKTLAEQKDRIVESLGKMQDLVVGGNRLVTYDYATGGKILLTGQADNYGVIARQIMSFRKSEYLASVEVTNIDLPQEGKINFTLSLIIK